MNNFEIQPKNLFLARQFSFLAVILLGLFLWTLTLHAQSQTPCHLITGSSQTPSGYASPVSFFGGSLLIKGDCNAGSIAVTVGNGEPTTYIYDKSYLWTGSQWQAKTLTGSNKQGAWIPKTATVNLTSSQSPTYYVAYTCEWVNQAWKCGCQNQSCTQNQWQLQIFQTQSGNQGGGDVNSSEDFPAPKRTVTVSSSGQLSSALANAQPGDHILLTNGSYGGFTIQKSGNSSNPIVVRAGQKLKANVTGNITIEGDHIIVAGFNMAGNRVRVLGKDIRVSSNSFRNGDHPVYVTSSAYRVEVDHNEIDQVGSNGEGNRRGIRFDYSTSGGNYNHHAHHNYLHDVNGRNNNAIVSSENGNTRSVQTGTVIEYNLMEDWVGGRCVGLKSGANTIQFNTCLRSKSEDMANRNGTNNKWIANWIEGSTGDALRIIDKGAQVIGNHIVGNAYIRIHAGNCLPPSNGLGNCPRPAYTAATDTYLVGNTGDVHVGDGYSTSSEYPARNTRIEANNGQVTLLKQVNTTQSNTNSYGTIPKAFKLSPSQVGPNASSAPSF